MDPFERILYFCKGLVSGYVTLLIARYMKYILFIIGHMLSGDTILDNYNLTLILGQIMLLLIVGSIFIICLLITVSYVYISFDFS